MKMVILRDAIKTTQNGFFRFP